MKRFAIAILLVLAAGCSSLPPEVMTEVDEATEIGQRILDEWNTPEMTESRKQKFIFRFVRVGHNVRYAVRGDAVPVAYIVSAQ